MKAHDIIMIYCLIAVLERVVSKLNTLVNKLNYPPAKIKYPYLINAEGNNTNINNTNYYLNTLGGLVRVK